ncbi:hypothetical protein JTF06_14360 [Desemzia sp. RIT804]|uniref:hypothetical protein n=1 Tax=Desemzia sp. RIT 804 TaxID=2810209 RepID=UPI001950EDB1|nr:hypothetical protein [Desemzia sp. RIT 804]MBM6616063.1 hypothetical protein [Desemzia sp. RIT 804]
MIKKSKLVCLATALILGASPLISTGTYVYASEDPGVTITEDVILDTEDSTSDSEITEVEYLPFSYSDYLATAEEQGVDVRGILGEEQYKQEMEKGDFQVLAGTTSLTKYKVGKETRYSLKVNSALVKVWKYGGSAAVTAMQIYGKSVGLPFDAPIYYGMKAALSNANAKKGYKWVIGTSPWRVVSSGVQ